MHFDDIGMIAANTTRSRVYLQALVQNELLPAFVLIMEEGSKFLPGQNAAEKPKGSSQESVSEEIKFSELRFRPGENLKTTLKKSLIPFDEIVTTDINSDEMLDALIADYQAEELKRLDA